MKETLNSNSQLQFQQYQQSNFSHLSPQIIEREKKNPVPFDEGNPGPGLRQTQKCGGIK